MAKKSRAEIPAVRSLTGPSGALTDAIKRKPARVSSDKLDQLKKLAREDRAILKRIENGNALLETLNNEHTEYKTKKLPELMESLGVPSIEIEGVGNEPPFKAEIRSYYVAGIKADWPDDQKKAGFDYLKSIGHDDLIKTYVGFAFPKGVSMSQIAEFIKLAAKIKIAGKKVKGKLTTVRIPDAEIERGVHWATLTSWLKDQVENHDFVPRASDLDKIGATIGRIVDIKEVKE